MATAPILHTERLRADHAPALLAFEQANRAFFARTIPDRGDAYFAEFADRHRLLLAEQEAGLHHFHVILDGDGALVGRVNLVDVDLDSDAGTAVAELGYRIAEHATGRGLATAAVRDVCALAATSYGLTALTAVTDDDNAASVTVLARNRFLPTGPTTVTGRPATRFRRALP